MKTTLKTDITVKNICEGFVYIALEGNPASKGTYFYKRDVELQI